MQLLTSAVDPAGHVAHDAAPAAALYVPGPQGKQPASTAALLYVPAAHCTSAAPEAPAHANPSAGV